MLGSGSFLPAALPGRLFTPRQLWGGRRWVLLSAWLSVRIRKYQGADEENHTNMCYLQWCFDEGGGFKIIVLKDNREGDFLMEN